MPIAETTPQQPINPYGFSKLVVERMLADYAAAYGFGFAALRYFNAAGAAPDGSIGEDHTPESHLIPIVLQVALGQRESISIFGDDYPTPDGTCIRDYVHVDDLASRPPGRARAPAARQVDQGEPRHRPRLQRARSDRRLPQDHRPSDSRRHCAAPPRRSARARRRRPPGPHSCSTGRRSTRRSNRSSKPPGAGTSASAGYARRRVPCHVERQAALVATMFAMQKIIVEKPYQFMPPYRGTFWPTIFRGIRIHDYYLRKTEGVVDHEIRHIERLRASLAAGHAILITPNHPRTADPLAMGWLTVEAPCHFHVHGELAPVSAQPALWLGDPGDGRLQRQSRRGRSAGDQHGDRRCWPRPSGR